MILRLLGLSWDIYGWYCLHSVGTVTELLIVITKIAMELGTNTLAKIFIPKLSVDAIRLCNANAVATLFAVNEAVGARRSNSIDTIADFLVKYETRRTILVRMFWITNAVASFRVKNEILPTILLNGTYALTFQVAPHEAPSTNLSSWADTLAKILVPKEVWPTFNVLLADAATKSLVVDETWWTFRIIVGNAIANEFVKDVTGLAPLGLCANTFACFRIREEVNIT